MDLSLKGLLDVLSTAVSTNLVRNPFFLADSNNHISGWKYNAAVMNGVTPAPGAQGNTLRMGPSGIAEQTVPFPLNTGHDALVLPKFTLTALLRRDVNRAGDSLRIEVCDLGQTSSAGTKTNSACSQTSTGYVKVSNVDFFEAVDQGQAISLTNGSGTVTGTVLEYVDARTAKVTPVVTGLTSISMTQRTPLTVVSHSFEPDAQAKLYSEVITIPTGTLKPILRLRASAAATNQLFHLDMVAVIPGEVDPTYLGQHAITELDLLSYKSEIMAALAATTSADYVDMTSNQTIDGVKTFVKPVVVPAASAANQAPRFDQVVQLGTANQTVGGTKTFGRLKSTATPTDANDVVRKADITERVLSPFASFVYFYAPVSSAWGSDPQLISIGSTAISSSGSDIVFEDGNVAMLLVNTTGYYEFVGTFHSPSNNEDHKYWFEIWHRPAGTTGASDSRIYYGRAFNGDGSILAPITAIKGAQAGDRFFVKAIGLRPTGAYLRCSFLGTQASTRPLSINVGNYTGQIAQGQQYPKIVTMGLQAQNSIGAVTWAITGGSAQSWASISGSVLTLNFPSTGTWTLNLQVTDASGATDTDTINLTLNDYVYTPVTITTGNLSFVAPDYPYSIEAPLASTGGVAPITWGLTGNNTTLPTPTISGNMLISSVSAAGSWTVEISAKDATNAIITKPLTITVEDAVYGGGGYNDDPNDPNPCFEASTTWVLMADGTGKLLKDVRPGDYVQAINESGYIRGFTDIRSALVTDVSLWTGDGSEANGFTVNGIDCTPGHCWATPKAWTHAADLAKDSLLAIADGKYIKMQKVVSLVKMDHPVHEHGDLGTALGSYFVGASESGPWYLVHNAFTETELPCYMT